MKVTKFGGSSLANAFQIQKVCNILLADEDRKSNCMASGV